MSSFTGNIPVTVWGVTLSKTESPKGLIFHCFINGSWQLFAVTSDNTRCASCKAGSFVEEVWHSFSCNAVCKVFRFFRGLIFGMANRKTEEGLLHCLYPEFESARSVTATSKTTTHLFGLMEVSPYLYTVLPFTAPRAEHIETIIVCVVWIRRFFSYLAYITLALWISSPPSMFGFSAGISKKLAWITVWCTFLVLFSLATLFKMTKLKNQQT